MLDVNALKAIEILEDLSKEQLAKLAPLAKEASFKAGTILIREGAEADKLYVVRGGKVNIEISIRMGPNQPPKSIAVGTAGPGHLVGWSAFVEPFIYTANVRCMEDTSVFIFPREELTSVLVGNADIGLLVLQKVNKVIASRLANTRKQLLGERGMQMHYSG